MSNVPYSIQLAVEFPPAQGLQGACTRVCDIPRWWRSKWLAVHLIKWTAFERMESYGNGNRAKKRAQRIRALSAPNVESTAHWDRDRLVAYYDRPNGYSGD